MRSVRESPVRPALMATAGIVAFVVGSIVRPDAALGLVVLGGLFVVLERVFPLRRQEVLRPGFATDCVHFVFDEVLAGLVLAAALLIVVPLLQLVVSDVVRQCIALQPRWIVVVEGLLLGEIAGYWGHRATHEIETLLSRFRPTASLHRDHGLARPQPSTPCRHGVRPGLGGHSLIVLGFSVPTIAAHFAIKRFQGLLVHANVRLDAGPLTWLIATPEFHHWHHADHPEAYNKNYAGTTPDGRLAVRVAPPPAAHVADPLRLRRPGPDRILAQLAWPFRRSRSTT